jgi:hypothetical protein
MLGKVNVMYWRARTVWRNWYAQYVVRNVGSKQHGVQTREMCSRWSVTLRQTR